MIAQPPPSKPSPENCPDCQHAHLGKVFPGDADVGCYHSTARENICLCKSPKGRNTMKANGKDPDIEIVHGNPVARRAKKVAEAFAPSARAKQTHLPGMKPKVIESVHQAIEDYVAARDARMELTKVEIEKKAHLLQAMKEQGITGYAVDGHEATLDVEETVKAKLVSEEIEEAEEREMHNRAIKPQDLARTPPPAGRKGRGRGRGAQA